MSIASQLLKKVLQSGPFQTELTNAVSQCATCQSVIFLIFLISFYFFKMFLKKK